MIYRTDSWFYRCLCGFFVRCDDILPVKAL